MKKMAESGPEQDAEEDIWKWKGGSNESCRNLHIEKLHDLYIPPYILTECRKKC
jgi:hypothetical protein